MGGDCPICRGSGFCPECHGKSRGTTISRGRTVGMSTPAQRSCTSCLNGECPLCHGTGYIAAVVSDDFTNDVPPPFEQVHCGDNSPSREIPQTGTAEVLSFRVAGVSFRNEDGTDRQHIIKQLRSGSSLRLVREPSNSYDSNAVRVMNSTEEQVGYVPKDLAPLISGKLDCGEVLVGKAVEITGVFDGGTRGVLVEIEVAPKASTSQRICESNNSLTEHSYESSHHAPLATRALDKHVDVTDTEQTGRRTHMASESEFDQAVLVACAAGERTLAAWNSGTMDLADFQRDLPIMIHAITLMFEEGQDLPIEVVGAARRFIEAATSGNTDETKPQDAHVLAIFFAGLSRSLAEQQVAVKDTSFSLDTFADDEQRLDALLSSDDELACDFTRLAMAFVAEFISRCDEADRLGMPGPVRTQAIGEIGEEIEKRYQFAFSIRSKEFLEVSTKNAVEVACNLQAFDEATAYGALNNLGYWLFFFPVLAKDLLMLANTNSMRTDRQEKFIEVYKSLWTTVRRRIGPMRTVQWMMAPFEVLNS